MTYSFALRNPFCKIPFLQFELHLHSNNGLDVELWPPFPAISDHFRPTPAAAGDRRPSPAIPPFPFHSFLLSFFPFLLSFLHFFLSFFSLFTFPAFPLPLSLSLSFSLLISRRGVYPASRQFLNANLRVLDICITRPSRFCIDAARSSCPRLCPSRVNATRNSRPRPRSPRVLT